ncbi:MAG: hypothetical protein KGL39_58480 [Patescibacteria group bacterium]|nr:hypothetical protein [Patescibacteria group bacterium]
MARPLRIEFPGAIYHVSSRMLGSWRQNRDLLFGDQPDRERFVQRPSEAATDFGVRLYVFTLMSNHCYRVLETPSGNLSRFMQSLSAAFRRALDCLSSEVVLQTVAEALGVGAEAFGQRKRNSALRAVASRYLIGYAGQTQREVAQRLGLRTGGSIQSAGKPDAVQTLRDISSRAEKSRGSRARGPLAHGTSNCAPAFGVRGARSRFSRIEPDPCG